MMTPLRNIGLMILLLLAGQMAAQVPVLDSVCSGAVRHYRVDGEAGSTYSWIITPPLGPVITLPSDADTVEIPWIYTAGRYDLACTQHAENGCDADIVAGQIIIFEAPDVFAGPDALVCIGRYYKLVNATAVNTISVLWETSGDGTFDNNTWLNPTYTPGPNDELIGMVTLKLTGYGAIADEDACAPSVSGMQLAVVFEIVPQFEPIGPLCQYSIPPALPDTSLEGITGTWAPPVISTDVLGDFDYTFYPNDPFQCGTDTTITITITNEIIPQFEPIGPLCINSVPPALPDTSLEGITGTWEPPVISTSVPGIFNFVFTPNDTTQCGLETDMDIPVVTEIGPEFAPIGPLCQTSTPPVLPGISINGISGTWTPPTIDTSIPGHFTYFFIPDPDQCGTDTIMEITILELVTPEFEPIGPLCQFSTAPILPGNSLNGITGTWSPAWINTAVPGIFTFIFTPDNPGHCGTVVTMDIIILPEITPQFEPIGPLCINSTPPALPDTSLNGIPGTWEPPFISTDETGTFFYTYIPDVTYPCVLEVTIGITVVSDIIPEFEPIGPLCQNSTPPALSGTSLNGITGSWVPPTIDTSVPGAFTYTFTPYDPGQCGAEVAMEIIIATEINPEFELIGQLCQNSVPPEFPGISGNGITGTWDPPAINTTIPGIFGYTFTPDNPAQCGTEFIMEIIISAEINPEFDPIGPVCQGSEPPELPDTSINGIQGNWDPMNISTTDPGIYAYTFTPGDPGQCGTDTIIKITIMPEIVPGFDPIGPLCQYSIPLVLPDTSLNSITGAWNPPMTATDEPGTFTYTFIPDEGQCTDMVTMEIEVAPEIIPVFDLIGPLNQNSTPPAMPDTSLNGISGTWDPPFIDSSVPGTYTYTFTPDAGQCAGITDMEITVLFDVLYAITGAGGHCLTGGAIVPLEVDNFTSVATFQLMLSYNVDKLLCEGYINVHPMLEAQAALTGVIDQVTGLITLNWQGTIPVTFTGQQTVCELVFTPKEPGQGQLTWYTGQTESYFTDLQGLPIAAQFLAEDFEIYEPPSIILEEQKTVCEGDTITIYGIGASTHPPLAYQWTYPDGSIQVVDPFFAGITEADAGDYILLVTDSLGCTDQKAIRLVVSGNPVAEFHGAGTLTVPPGYTLEAGTGQASYLWNTGETNENIRIDTTGLYWVEMVSHVGCTGIDSVYVIISEIPEECLFIPNAFSPNSDGLNDTFKAVSICPLSSFQMMIYNRWGEELFETGDLSEGWDGKKNGVLCQAGAYVYKIVYKPHGSPAEGRETVKTGMVVIVK